MPRIEGVSASSTVWLIRRSPMPFDDRGLLPVESDRALHERHLDALRVGRFLRCFFSPYMVNPDRRHLFEVLAAQPRDPAGTFSDSSPLKVARTTLCGLADPSDLVSTLCRPAASTTARTAPPAMMPVPSGAGFSSTLPDPNLPTIGVRNRRARSGTRISPSWPPRCPS